jgi:hypothetical protein
MTDERLEALSRMCVKRYTFDDVIKHFEEECIEVLMAIKRVERGKDHYSTFLEELVDVSIEVNTVMELLSKWAPELKEMAEMKKEKFAYMMERDKQKYGTEEKLNRYRSLEEIMNELRQD